ncbi:unnamed protein product [Victoria cruziana]
MWNSAYPLLVGAPSLYLEWPTLSPRLTSQLPLSHELGETRTLGILYRILNSIGPPLANSDGSLETAPLKDTLHLLVTPQDSTMPNRPSHSSVKAFSSVKYPGTQFSV